MRKSGESQEEKNNPTTTLPQRLPSASKIFVPLGLGGELLFKKIIGGWGTVILWKNTLENSSRIFRDRHSVYYTSFYL